MQICYIGKYPPIEGGVSAQGYWTLRGLAEIGHTVHVVTNANEVETAFRSDLQAEDFEWLEPRFENAGRICLTNTSPLRSLHVPASNPFVTKLATLATEIVRRHQCEVIFGSYFEPYGIAAFLASKWTGVPFIIKHAGSDLERLMAEPDLCTAYQEMIRAARHVITDGRLVERFVRLGLDREQIYVPLPFSLPTKLFNPEQPPMTPDEIVKRVRSARHGASPTINLSVPTIGTYGKVAEVKGTYDLLGALCLLKKAGMQFNVLTVTNGDTREQFASFAEPNQLGDRMFSMNFIPPWRIPGFIRTCLAVCCLEREFPVTIHTPILPREVLACGVSLVTSAEIKEKFVYGERLKNRENVFIVDDPRDAASLADSLRRVLADQSMSRQVGMNGARLSADIEDYAGFVSAYDDLLINISNARRPTRAQLACFPLVRADVSTSEAGPIAPQAARVLFPLTTLLLERANVGMTFGDMGSDETPLAEMARAWSRLVSEYLRSEKAAGLPPFVHDIYRYEELMFRLSFDDSYAGPAFEQSNIWDGAPIMDEKLKPIKSKQTIVDAFRYDLTVVLPKLKTGVTPSSIDQVDTWMLLSRTPHYVMRSFRINENTRWMLDICRGELAISEIIDQWVKRNGLGSSDGTAVRGFIMSTINCLCNLGILRVVK